MDTLTHALSGALVARATAPRQPRPDQLSLRRRTWIGFLAGAFSDGDIVYALFGHIAYLENHRGVTHSLLLLPLWAWLLALACAFFLQPRQATWRNYYWVILLAILIHISGDLITGYGTQILAPFSNWAPGWNTTFIIDFWLTGLLLLGLVASFFWRPRLGAALGLAGVVILVLFQFSQHRKAVELAENWAVEQGYRDFVAQAYPQPWSPFNWKLVVDHGEHYHMAAVNLGRQELLVVDDQAPAVWRIRANYRPVTQLVWRQYSQFGHPDQEALAREVWGREEMKFFHWFASYPALQDIQEIPAIEDIQAHQEIAWQPAETCVIFRDLRFELEGLRLPFRYGMCRAGDDAEWQLYRFPGSGQRQAL